MTLYGRAGCHLCEEARSAVTAAAAARGLTIEEVDIALDPRLERRYGERIPVLAVDGEEALELRFNAAEVVEAVDRVRA